VGIVAILSIRPLFHFVWKWNNRLRNYARREEVSAVAWCYGGQVDLKSGA